MGLFSRQPPPPVNEEWSGNVHEVKAGIGLGAALRHVLGGSRVTTDPDPELDALLDD